MDGDIGPQVVFDFGGVLDLCRDLWALATDLETYGVTRDTALATALEMWRGPEATSMVTEVWPSEDLNLTTGIGQLKEGALAWAFNWADAQQMHNNRTYQIAVKQEKDTRSGGEKVVDLLFGADDSARHVPAPAASVVPAAPGFEPTTGFVSYIQHAHSDWTATYRMSIASTGGGGGNRVL